MTQKEFVDIDAMLAQSAALPRVQQAIIHVVLTKQLELDPSVTAAVDQKRVAWLYNTSSQDPAAAG